MIDAAAEHDQPDTLPYLYPIMLAQAADYAAGEVAGDLNHSVPRPRAVIDHDQVALIMFAGMVAEGGVKLARRVGQRDDFPADGRAIDMHVERRHEDRNTAKPALRKAARGVPRQYR